MKKYSVLIVLCMMFLSSLECAPQLVLNNRVLAKVNGKAITVMDVAKKMDMILLRQYPEEFASSQVRYEFYQANWQKMLSDMIDRELVMLAADELNWPVPTGDVRQEMEEMFGPNVRLNLESAGLTYEEVMQMVRADITIRRMLSLKVNSRVLAEITPERVKKAYEEYTKDGALRAEYTYRIITCKSSDVAKAEAVAKAALKRLQEMQKEGKQVGFAQVDFAQFEDAVKQDPEFIKEVSLSCSEPFCQKQDLLAEQVKNVLKNLEKGQASDPVVQRSRQDGTPLVRLYVLEDKKEAAPTSFADLEPKIKDHLIRVRMTDETEKYFSSLRKHFDVRLEEIEKELPRGFMPFALKAEPIKSTSFTGIASNVTGEPVN